MQRQLPARYRRKGVAAMTTQAVQTVPALPGRNVGGGRERMKGILSKAVSWLGIAVIAVLAVPAGVLILLIIGIWSLTDWLVARLSGKEEAPHDAG